MERRREAFTRLAPYKIEREFSILLLPRRYVNAVAIFKRSFSAAAGLNALFGASVGSVPCAS